MVLHVVIRCLLGTVALLAFGGSSSLATPFEITHEGSVIAKIDDSGDLHALCSGDAMLNLCDLVRERATLTTSATMTNAADAFSVSLDGQAQVAVSADGSLYACGHNVCDVISGLVAPSLGVVEGFFVNDAFSVDSDGSVFTCGVRNLCALSWATVSPTPNPTPEFLPTPLPIPPLPECTETIGYSSSDANWNAQPQFCMAYHASTPVERTGLARSFSLTLSEKWDGLVTVWVSEDISGKPGNVLGVGSSGRIVFDAHATYTFLFNDAFAIPPYTNAWICAQGEPLGLTTSSVWPLAADSAHAFDDSVTLRNYAMSVANDTISVGIPPPLTTFEEELLNNRAPSLEIFFGDCDCDATPVGYTSGHYEWNAAPQMCFVYDALNPVGVRDVVKTFSLTMWSAWTGRVTTWIALDDGFGSPGLVVGVSNTGNVNWNAFVPQQFPFDVPFHLTEGQVYHVCVNGEPNDATTTNHWPLASNVTLQEHERGALKAYNVSVAYDQVVVGEPSPVGSLLYMRVANVAPSIELQFGSCLCDSSPIGFATSMTAWSAYPITCLRYDETSPLGNRGDVASFTVAMSSAWSGRVTGWIVEDLDDMPEGNVLGVGNSGVIGFNSHVAVEIDFVPTFSVPPFQNVWVCVQGEPDGSTSGHFWPLGTDNAKNRVDMIEWVAYEETIDVSSIVVGLPTPFSAFEASNSNAPMPSLQLDFAPCA